MLLKSIHKSKQNLICKYDGVFVVLPKKWLTNWKMFLKKKCCFTEFKYKLAFVGPFIRTIGPISSENILHTIKLFSPNLADFLSTVFV